jgi:hypothetical protein
MDGRLSMHRRVVGLIALAALVLAAILAIAPHTTVIANELTGEVYGIDVAGLTHDAEQGPARIARQQ